MQATFEISEFSLIAKHSEHKKKKIKVTLTIFHILCNSFLLFLSSGPRFSSSILIFRKKPTLSYVNQPRYQSETTHTLLWKYLQMKLTFVWENFAHGRTLKWKVNCTRKWLRYFVIWNVWMQTGWHIKEHKEDCTAEFACVNIELLIYRDTVLANQCVIIKTKYCAVQKAVTLLLQYKLPSEDVP